MWEEVKVLCSSVNYVLITLGYAALTGVLLGLATFGSSFFMGLSIANSQEEASITFGILVSISGLIGFPLGGMIIDRLTHKNRDEHKENSELLSASYVMTITSSAGLLFFIIFFLLRTKYTLMLIIFIACIFLFITNSATSFSIMYSVSVKNRTFAISFSNIMVHLLGDVPSPIIAGLIKDKLAPGCVSNGDDDEVSTSDECRDDAEGLRLTMLLISLWLIWCIIFFGSSYIYTRFYMKSKM
jgi:MFS family permease